MAKVISCGVLILNAQRELFVCHTTDTSRWDLPNGVQDPGESALQTAVREAQRPRWHMHFVPSYSSWLNQVERFFSITTSRAIRRGSFSSVKELTSKITKFVDNYNETCQPFTWTATADSILRRASRTSHDNAPEVRRPADTFPWRLPIQCALDKSGVQIGVSQASTALTGSSARNCSF